MILKIIAKNLLLLSLVGLSFLLGSCDKAADGDSAESAASEFTIASNQKFSESLDLDNQQDFEDATRGLVASAPADIITNSYGQKVWDASAYDFIQGDAPDTVNPSLWRQAKLNNIRGLFEVDEGIYQLRGFDLANTTLIKGQNGWIVVDPLTTLETTKSAMAFAEQHLGEINLSAVIFTHSHIDHFGGVLSLIDAQQAAENNIPIIAPRGFYARSGQREYSCRAGDDAPRCLYDGQWARAFGHRPCGYRFGQAGDFRQYLDTSANAGDRSASGWIEPSMVSTSSFTICPTVKRRRS